MVEATPALFELKQCKKAEAIARFLMGLGVREDSAWNLALSAKVVALSRHSQDRRGMSLSWFKSNHSVPTGTPGDARDASLPAISILEGKREHRARLNG